MYEAKFLGHTIRLVWGELRSLRARFNLKNFKPPYVGSPTANNTRSCVLCNKYRSSVHDCDTCPLKVFRGRSSRVPCFTMMQRMLNRKNLCFTCNPHYVTYNTKRGRNNIEKIAVLLERFKKVL